MRWATPGIDVDCAGRPRSSGGRDDPVGENAAAFAAKRRDQHGDGAGRGQCCHRSCRHLPANRVACRAGTNAADHSRCACRIQRAVPPGGVAHDLGADRRTGTARPRARLRRTGRSRRSTRSRSPPDRCAADRATASPTATGSRTGGCRNDRRCRFRHRRRSWCAPRVRRAQACRHLPARTRRWRASWHSPSAMMTFRPCSAVAQRFLQRVDIILADANRCAPCASI